MVGMLNGMIAEPLCCTKFKIIEKRFGELKNSPYLWPIKINTT
jgi:hypothetical protein